MCETSVTYILARTRYVSATFLWFDLCWCAQGVIAGLDRKYFEVIIMCIANPQAFLSPDVLRTANEVHHVPLVKEEGNRVRVLSGNCKFVLHSCGHSPPMCDEMRPIAMLRAKSCCEVNTYAHSRHCRPGFPILRLVES